MNRQIALVRWIVVSVLLCPTLGLAADFTIDEWSLDAAVDGSQYDLVFNDVVQNPYDELLQAISPVPDNASFADGHHQISWNDHTGVFRLDGGMAAEYFESSVVTSASSARILITPTTDLIIRYSGSFAFDLPAEDTAASLSLRILDPNSPLHILQQGFAWDSFLGLGARSFDYEGEVIMPAGHTWALQYSMSMTAYGNSAGHVATGSGFAEYRIIPEPAALLLCAPMAILLLRRRRRSQARDLR